MLGQVPKFHVRVVRVTATRLLRRALHSRGPSVLVVGPSLPNCCAVRLLGRRANYARVGYVTLLCTITSRTLLQPCSSRVGVCSDPSRVHRGLRHLRASPRRRARGRRRRALDTHRGRVIIYIIGKVAGHRVTSHLFLSARAIIARQHGVTQGLRMRDTDNLAMCTVIGGLIRLGSVGLWSVGGGGLTILASYLILSKAFYARTRGGAPRRVQVPSACGLAGGSVCQGN